MKRKKIEKERELKKKEEQPKEIPKTIEKIIILKRDDSILTKLGEYVWIVKINLKHFDDYLIEKIKKNMTEEELEELGDEEPKPGYFELLEIDKREKILNILRDHIKFSQIKFPIQIQICFKHEVLRIITDPNTKKEI
ncbi:MAG: hypothetical protein NZZ41_06655 [Candidatus Dojkabacteria bacterium]|nr:hypothetical protein [Candidatus Dojkabacteria bacterium]